jgi:phospholipid/cholesterol/gamma-HCH transport system permease protein
VTAANYEYGIQYSFEPKYVGYSIFKAMIFAYIIASTAAFFGYYVKGSAKQVGEAGMKAVVNSNILILASDVLITLLYV